MSLTALDYLAAAGAAGAAGAVNALAGGGSLISFPTLVALGVPPVTANVTNTVALLPGYLSGTWAQRDDLRPQVRRARVLALVAGAGGLAGSVLLVLIPAEDFRVAIPYLILLSCALLLFQDRIRAVIRPATAGTGAPASASTTGSPPPADASEQWSLPLLLTVFIAAVYGGFFGAGLGIMLLALLGLFSAAPLVRLNALKQALSFVINLVAAVFFVFSGHVRWDLAPLMAVAALIGGFLGGRLVRVIDPVLLRQLVVAAGVAVAIAFWVA
jgi:uncharacterized protein